MEEKLASLILAQFGVTVLLLVILAWTLFKIGAEFAKLRKEVSYEVNRELLTKRFEAYAGLWTKMQDLAIYGDAPFGSADARALERRLSDWYFSAEGGLLLTKEAREFYFALQDSLRATAAFPEWCCQKRPTKTREAFLTLMTAVADDDERLADCRDLIEKKTPEEMNPDLWLEACRAVVKKLEDAQALKTPEGCARAYSALQQISSILRTRLAFEVRSRLAVELPR